MNLLRKSQTLRIERGSFARNSSCRGKSQTGTIQESKMRKQLETEREDLCADKPGGEEVRERDDEDDGPKTPRRGETWVQLQGP